MPRLASNDNIHALRLFATFFVPFYFFHAGTLVSRDALSWEALGLGLVITAVVLPLRIGMVWLQRRVLFRANGARAPCGFRWRWRRRWCSPWCWRRSCTAASGFPAHCRAR